MNAILDNIVRNFSNINWEGPAAFVVAILAVLALMRKWSLALLVLLIVAIGWGAQDLIVFNLETKSDVVSVPLMIYIGGGILVFILAFISFFKPK